MALTPLRWMAIAVAMMLGVFILTLTDRKPLVLTEEERHLDSLQASVAHHSARTSMFSRQLRMVELTDSLRAASTRAAQPGIRATFGPGVDPQIRSAIDSALVLANQKTGPSPVIGVDIATVVDSAEVAGRNSWQWIPTPFYILPTQANERCTVVIPMGKGLSTRNFLQYYLNTDDARNQILGPCAFYAAFGMPGDSIRAWLRGRGALLASGGSWTQQTWSKLWRRGERLDGPSSSPVFYPTPPAAMYSMSGRAVGCAAADATACESLLRRRNQDLRSLTVGSAVLPGFRLGPIGREYGYDVAGRETELLADMVRSMGRERFQKFWTSNESVSASIEKASGLPATEWMASWVGEPLEGLERGPKIRGASMLGAIGVVVVCLLITVLAARRRQFA
jgi:hypothetical protein